MVSNLLYHQRKQTGLAFVILYEGSVVGQLNVANILHGSVSSATIGYWIAKDYAGRNITPYAVALAIDGAAPSRDRYPSRECSKHSSGGETWTSKRRSQGKVYTYRWSLARPFCVRNYP